MGDLYLGFDDGSPDGYDPLQLAREMAARGITLVSLHFTCIHNHFLIIDMHPMASSLSPASLH